MNKKQCKICGRIYMYNLLAGVQRCICGSIEYKPLIIPKLFDIKDKSKKDCKDFSSKPIYHDVPIKAVAQLGHVTLAAKKKYGNTNTWRDVDAESALRYANALMRHTLAFLGGEVIDPETGIDHRILAMWNAGASWETEELWRKYVGNAYDEEKENDMK